MALQQLALQRLTRVEPDTCVSDYAIVPSTWFSAREFEARLAPPELPAKVRKAAHRQLKRLALRADPLAPDSFTGFSAVVRATRCRATDGNQAFAFIGSGAFTGQAGQVRAVNNAGVWVVEADVDGDRVADLLLNVTVTGGHQMAAADFVL